MPELLAKLLAILAVFAVVATLRRAEQVEMTSYYCSFCQTTTKSLLKASHDQGERFVDVRYDKICSVCRVSY